MIRVMRFAVVAVAGLVAACAAAPDRPSQPEPSSTFRTGLATVTARQHMAASANRWRRGRTRNTAQRR
jgi:hypothetical protein